MSVDLQLLQAIHRIESELDQINREVKQLEGDRSALIAELPESEALADALQALYEARTRLRIAIRDNHEVNRLEVDLAEVRFKRRDLKEILSHHLVVYTQDTGRDVVKDHESRNRQIELKAKLGKPTLDQARLPLGFGRHFNKHVEIPTPPAPQHLEVTPEPAS
jgi:hypothetical protein